MTNILFEKLFEDETEELRHIQTWHDWNYFPIITKRESCLMVQDLHSVGLAVRQGRCLGGKWWLTAPFASA